MRISTLSVCDLGVYYSVTVAEEESVERSLAQVRCCVTGERWSTPPTGSTGAISPNQRHVSNPSHSV